jgi:hypothetical protein
MPTALKITLGNTTISRSLGKISDYAYTPPALDNLVGWFNIGIDAKRSRKNWAPGGDDAVVVGAPTFHADGGARFTSLSAYMQTSIPETDDLTIMVVAKSSDTFADLAHRPAFVSTYTGVGASNSAVTSDGAMLSVIGVGTVRMTAYRRAVDGSATHSGSSNNITPDLANWGCYFGTINGLVSRVRDKTGGSSSSFTHSLPRFRSANTFRIGSAFNGLGGHCDILTVGLWSAPLSDATEEAAYQQAKADAAARYGIDI